MSDSPVTIELMRRISAAFNSRDVDRIVDCFAEDGVFCLARGPESVGRTLKGKETIRKTLGAGAMVGKRRGSLAQGPRPTVCS